jgi:hypothetical protein
LLDVHAPHGRLEGVKDFFLHLFTITIGLLIALGLENLAERVHKNEVRLEAEADLRREVEDNQKKLTEWHVIMHDEEKSLRGALIFLLAKEQGKDVDPGPVNLGFTIKLLSDASWRTASATGALSLMDYEQVQAHANAYGVQEQVMLLERETLEDFMTLQAHIIAGFDPRTITPQQALSVEPEVRRALAHLMSTDQVSQSLDKDYADLLTGKH